MSAAPLLDTSDLDEVLYRYAREDVNAFATVVLRDEQNLRAFDQAPHHIAWQELADKNRNLVLWSAIEHGKTWQLSILRTLWELGRDPMLRFAIISATQKMAQKISLGIASYIERSVELHKVFPKLKPSTQWSPLTGSFTVERPGIAKDPSVQSVGTDGHILGARLDRIILDDTVGLEHVKNQDNRDKLWDWVQANLMGRLVDGGRVIIVGTAHHRDDIMHRFAKMGWPSFMYPVLDPATGKPRWPERWSLARIEEVKNERFSPVEFARQMLCVVSDDASSRFKYEWIERGLKRGDGKKTYHSISEVPPGCRVFTGVDLAVQKHAAADQTVFFTIMVYPNGDRQILNLDSGRWHGPEILDRCVDTRRRYQGTLVVENVAAQDYIRQMLNAYTAVPVIPFTTGKGQASLAVQTDEMSIELRNGKWIIPNRGGVMEPEVHAWVQNLLEYDPSLHCPDRVAASCFARHGAIQGQQKIQTFPGNLLRR